MGLVLHSHSETVPDDARLEHLSCVIINMKPSQTLYKNRLIWLVAQHVKLNLNLN